MNTEKLSKSINDYFSKVSAEHVVSKLKQLGCEFDDLEESRIDYDRSVNMSVELSSDVDGRYTIKKSVSHIVKTGFDLDALKFATDDSYYDSMNEAA